MHPLSVLNCFSVERKQPFPLLFPSYQPPKESWAHFLYPGHLLTGDDLSCCSLRLKYLLHYQHESMSKAQNLENLCCSLFGCKLSMWRQRSHGVFLCYSFPSMKGDNCTCPPQALKIVRHSGTAATEGTPTPNPCICGDSPPFWLDCPENLALHQHNQNRKKQSQPVHEGLQ